MKTKDQLAILFTAALCLLPSGHALADGSGGPAARTNLALQCSKVEANYTASWNNLYAVYDGVTGFGELANNKTWADWSNSRPANGWIAYTWDNGCSIDSVAVYYWTDTGTAGGGVHVPESWVVQYYDDDAADWKDVTVTGGSYSVERTSANGVSFEPVEAKRLRLWMNAASNGSTYSALGVTEFEVWGHTIGGETVYGDYPISNVPFNDVSLTDSFWAPRAMQNQEVTIPIALKNCYDYGRLDNFKKAAYHLGRNVPGTMTGYFVGDNTFDDTDIYKIIEGMAYSIQTKYSKALDDEMDTLIYWIGQAQEDDGYLMTARTAGAPNNLHSWLGKERWTEDPNLSHELYNCGHLYEAAVAHYQSTGKRTLLDIAIKNADLLVKDFLVGGLTYEPGHQIVEMGLVKMYRVTGNQDYLKLAKYFLDLRGTRGVGRKEYSQTHLPVVDQKEAVGHAVRAGYMYSGMADIAAIMGNEDYKNAIDTIWGNVAYKKLYINGGIGARHSGESFGDNYELPNASAYCETCAAISNVYWNWRMFLLSGDSKYYDVLERSLYNGVISGIGLDGKTFFYPNPLASTGGYARSEWFGCACCPSNLCRFLPSVSGYVYAHRGDSVYVNLYMQNSALVPVKDGNIRLSQTTEYPWKGDINVTIDSIGSNSDLTLMLRLPGWANGKPVPSDLYSYVDGKAADIKLYVNGKETAYTLDKGYMAVSRTWAVGDKVRFSLPMDIHRTVANDNVAADKGLVELERGPIVYCLEWPDNDSDFSSLYVSDNDSVSTEWSSELNGIYKLNINGSKAVTDKSGAAVRTAASIVAIPYYAWDNRGSDGAMEIWMPRSIDAAQVAVGEVATDTLDLAVTMKPFTDTSAKTYASTAVSPGKGKVAQLLGVTESRLDSLYGSKITYAAINPDGSLNSNSTANAPGHWFDAKGNTVSWGSGAYVFSELNASTLTFNVGQYPARCSDGKVYTMMQALTYLPADGVTEAHRVVFRIRLQVLSDQTPVKADTISVVVNAEPFTDTAAKIYDSYPYYIDKSTVEAVLGIAADSLALAYKDSMVVFQGIEDDGSLNGNQTAKAPGQWMDADGNVVSFSTNGSNVIFSELNANSCILSVGQYPGKCKVGDSYAYRQALTTTHVDAEGYRHRLVLDVTLNIVADAPVPVVPTADGSVSIENLRVNTFVHDFEYAVGDASVVENFNAGPIARRDHPATVTLQWTAPAGTAEQTITYSRKADMSDALTASVAAGASTCRLTNLYPATYYYYVSADGRVVDSGSFTTTGQVRMIETPTLANIRDLGGWTTADGDTIAYGLLYRGTELNGEHTATEADIQTLRDLGIKAELDLRTASQANSVGASPLGEDIAYERVESEATYSTGASDSAEYFKRDFDFIISQLRQRHPVYFHCIWGCDRTGTLAFLLEGLLGVPVSDLCKDFELSTFSGYGTTRTKANLTNLFTYIQGLDGETLQGQFRTYWTTVAGIPADDVDEFRNIMLGNGGTTTGISSLKGEGSLADGDAPAYNVAGQRVGKAYKGIVIMNGRKFVRK